MPVPWCLAAFDMDRHNRIVAGVPEQYQLVQAGVGQRLAGFLDRHQRTLVRLECADSVGNRDDDLAKRSARQVFIGLHGLLEGIHLVDDRLDAVPV
jgi:hypothetical protein